MNARTRKTVLAVLLFALVVCACFAFAGCSSNYQVAWDLGYTGAPVMENTEVAAGELLTMPAAPVRAGYRFDGWYNRETGTKFNEGEAVSADLVLYAKWVKQYTVIWNMNDSANTVFETTTVDEGAPLELPATQPVLNGHEFAGWAYDAEGLHPVATTVAIASDTTLYARWTMSHAISWNLNYAGAATLPVTYVADNGHLEVIEAPVREGYLFTGWYKDAGCKIALDETVAVTKSMVLYAGWIQTHTVSWNLNYSGAANWSATQVVDGAAAVVPSVAPVRSGYKFTGWYLDGACEQPYDTNTAVTSNITLFAGWQQTAFTVSYRANYTGAPEIAGTGVNLGDVIPVPAVNPSRTGYEFAGWYKDAACTIPFDASEVATGTVVLYAGWDKLATVTYMLNGAEYTTASYKVGEFVEHPQAPEVDGYAFVAWIKSSDNTVLAEGAVVYGDITVVASMQKTRFEVAFDANYAEATNPAALTKNIGEVVDLSTVVLTRDNYRFDGWFLEAECVHAVSSIAVTEDVTLFAKWTRAYTVVWHMNDGVGTEPETTHESIVYVDEVISYPTVDSFRAGETTTLKPEESLDSIAIRNGYRLVAWYYDEARVETFRPFFKVGDMAVNGITEIHLYAKWYAVVTVNYNWNNAAAGKTGVYATQFIEINTAITAHPAAPAIEHYTFDGWYTDAAATTPYDIATILTDPVNSTELYAKWIPTTFDVTFVLPDASNATDAAFATQTILEASKATAPTVTPLRDKVDHVKTFVFNNWYTSATPVEGETPFDFANTEIWADTTLYARWDEYAIYTVNFELQGSVEAPVTPATIATQYIETHPGQSQLITKPADPTRATIANTMAYEFNNWYLTATLAEDSTAFDFANTKVTEVELGEGVTTITIYAIWNEFPYYKVTIDLQGELADDSDVTGIAAADLVKYVATGTADSKLYATPATVTKADVVNVTSFEFVGWYFVATPGEDDAPVDFTTMVTTWEAAQLNSTTGVYEVTIYAVWNAFDIYHVTFDLHATTECPVTPATIDEQYIRRNPTTGYPTVVEPADPTRADNIDATTSVKINGWHFKGWYTVDTEGNETDYDFDSEVTSDLVLHARWIEVYTIRFVAYRTQDATTGAETIMYLDELITGIKTEYEKGEKVERPTAEQIASLNHTGYNFSAWYTKALVEGVTTDIVYNFNTLVSANLTIEALWEEL